jgi:molybdopterin/thiamine biosynthesis adenylyltransferase
MKTLTNKNFERNIGLLSVDQQQKLFDSHAVVAGVGGMGGVAAEALVRMGIGTLTIVDHDNYELSNVNRQIHCTEKTIGRPKVDVVGERLIEINSGLKLHKHHFLSEENVGEIVNGADILINGMDDIKASITLERCARSKRVTIVDAWITPYASVFVMTPESTHWEDFLDFPTKNKRVDQISREDAVECLRREVEFTLSHFEPYTIIAEEVVNEIIEGRVARPSLVPVVWLSGTLMANEAMKILTGQGVIAGHYGVFYNQYTHEIKVVDAWKTNNKRD